MNPLDSNVEPIGAASRTATRETIRGRRKSEVTDGFIAWLKEETIAITAEHFGTDALTAVSRLIPPRKLARIA